MVHPSASHVTGSSWKSELWQNVITVFLSADFVVVVVVPPTPRPAEHSEEESQKGILIKEATPEFYQEEKPVSSLEYFSDSQYF